MRQIDLSVRGRQALADGIPIDVPAGLDPASALIAHAQRQAATSGGLLAHVRDDHGTDVWLAIGADGSVSEAQPPAVTAPPEPESAPPTALSAWATESSGSSAKRTPSVGTPVARRAALGGLGVLALGGLLWWAASGDDADDADSSGPSSDAVNPDATTSRTPAAVLPDGQVAPAGWSNTSRWSLEDVADARAQLAQRDNLLALVLQPAGAGKLTLQMLDARTGKPRWNADLPHGLVLTDGPYLVQRDRLLVMCALNNAVLAWDAHTGKQVIHAKYPKPGLSTGFGLLGPWVKVSESRFLGLTSKGLKPFDIPKGTSCFGCAGDRMLVLSPRGEAWLLTTGKKRGKPTKLIGPKGYGMGAVCAVTDTRLIVSWGREKNTQLRAYDLKNLKEVWSTGDETSWEAYVGNTQVAPNQRWAVVGNRWVDLTSGRTQLVAPRFKPVGISDRFAWGDDGRYILSCNDKGELTSAKPTRPADETVAICGGIDDQALVVASIGALNTLYALPRA